MRLLDEIFLAFDDLVKQAAGALKIETIAGVYLVASNGALAVSPISSTLLLWELAKAPTKSEAPDPHTGVNRVNVVHFLPGQVALRGAH